MTADGATLGEECRVFTRYLTGRDPSPYILAKYVDAHRVLPGLSAPEPREAWTVRWAAGSPLRARLADAAARRRDPRGLLRRKLVLLLAILETAPETHALIDRTPASSLAGALVTLAWTGLVGVAVTVAGLIVCGLARASAGGREPR